MCVCVCVCVFVYMSVYMCVLLWVCCEELNTVGSQWIFIKKTVKKKKEKKRKIDTVPQLENIQHALQIQ